MWIQIEALIHIRSQKDVPEALRRQPKALVIAPTRELCLQITEESEDFCGEAKLRTCAIYGGASRSPQMSKLRQGVDLVVATPGRLLDLASTGVFTLDNTSYVVLDEADRCLDMGFEPQIRDIMEKVRSDRQTVMFSATWPREIQSLAG